MDPAEFVFGFVWALSKVRNFLGEKLGSPILQILPQPSSLWTGLNIWQRDFVDLNGNCLGLVDKLQRNFHFKKIPKNILPIIWALSNAEGFTGSKKKRIILFRKG
jgi:hypothetical protein